MTRTRERTVGEVGERALIEQIRRAMRRAAPREAVLIGDDAAVLAPPPARGGQVVSTDLLVEGTHWREGHLSPAQLGRRALVANLSDLAAMGAEPLWFTLGLAMPAHQPEAWFRGVTGGLARAAQEFACPWVGGDIVRSPVPTLAITVAGHCRRAPLLRSGAKPDQTLFVTGDLGRAALALLLLDQGEPVPRWIAAKHLRPQPRLREAAALAAAGAVGAAMDVSDGLVRDLPWIADLSGVRVEVDLESLPTRPALRRASGVPPEVEAWAASSGEEFELVFTSSLTRGRLRELLREAGSDLPITAIGRVTRGHGVTWLRGGKPVEPPALAAWDHFSQGSGPGAK